MKEPTAPTVDPSGGAVVLAHVTVGAAVPADRPALAACLSGLSPTSLHRRFHAPVHRVPERFLDDLTARAADGLVRVARSGGHVVGIAEVAPCSAEPGTYEVAVVVADDWHRRGVATALLRDLARDVPATHLRGRVQFDNAGAQHLARSLVPDADRRVEDGIVIEVPVAPGAAVTQARASTSSYPARRQAM